MSVSGFVSVSIPKELLGKKAKDKVSGFEGTVSAVCEYLYASPSVELTPQAKPGEKPVSDWFDIARIEPVDESK